MNISPLNGHFPETELKNSHVSCQTDSVLNDQKPPSWQDLARFAKMFAETFVERSGSFPGI